MIADDNRRLPRNVFDLFWPMLYLNNCPCGSTPVLFRCWIADCSLEWPPTISSDGFLSVAKKSKYATFIIIRMQQKRSNAIMMSLHWIFLKNITYYCCNKTKLTHLGFDLSDTIVSFRVRSRLSHFKGYNKMCFQLWNRYFIWK